MVDHEPRRDVPGPADPAIEWLDRPLEDALKGDAELDADRYLLRAFMLQAPRLRGYALSLVRDLDVADDLVQESFLRLIAEVRAGRRPGNVAAWLHRVCINLVVSASRRQTSYRRAIPRLAEVGVASSPEEQAERHDRDARVLVALADLPLEARAALLLAADGLDSREIGFVIGRTPLATRAYLCRMRGRLNRVLDA